jgi:hypothetical protein
MAKETPIKLTASTSNNKGSAISKKLEIKIPDDNYQAPEKQIIEREPLIESTKEDNSI